MYDIKSSLTRICNRSSADNFDDSIFSFIVMLCTFDRHRVFVLCHFSVLLSFAL